MLLTMFKKRVLDLNWAKKEQEEEEEEAAIYSSGLTKYRMTGKKSTLLCYH